MQIDDWRTTFAPSKRRLPRKAITYARTRTAVESALLATVGTVATAVLAPGDARPFWFGAVGVLVLVIVAVDIPCIDRARILSVSYDVDKGFVRLRRGIVFVEDIVVPIERILNVAIVQGPILRVFGLVRIRFVTISRFDALGPLDLDVALRLRAEVQRHQDRVSIASDER
ncbi:PH domain-containing protein [Microbacterium sp. SA39]|uniref:PH domain-containing protein n=1 Tax=Microbacterium sp. SA39 TaxID=1263625 RepID=UPI0005FA5A9F|nr:PH domain-containing protein [Microbacterium sp. SA39]KJQ52458.1 Bacterial membrane flanked domain protein [Microbacterium sp. SA39]